MSKPRKRKRTLKRVLALPDLEQSKAAVLSANRSFATPSMTGSASSRKGTDRRNTLGADCPPLADRSLGIKTELKTFP